MDTAGRDNFGAGREGEFDPFDHFAQFERSNGKSLPNLLTEITHLRNLNLEKLIGWQICEEDLKLTGLHPEFGEVSLGQLRSTWVVHDLGHIRQIVTFMARKYKYSVGPWKQYLSIRK